MFSPRGGKERALNVKSPEPGFSSDWSSNLNGSVTFGAGAFFLLALNGSIPRFLHKTLKDEQKLVTYKKKIVSGTKQVVILVLAGRFSNFFDNVKPYAR